MTNDYNTAAQQLKCASKLAVLPQDRMTNRLRDWPMLWDAATQAQYFQLFGLYLPCIAVPAHIKHVGPSRSTAPWKDHHLSGKVWGKTSSVSMRTSSFKPNSGYNRAESNHTFTKRLRAV